VGAAVRALQFFAPFHWPFHWDETMLATAALQVLDGGLPVNTGQEYFGAAVSYLMAAWFALVGPSTLANDLTAYAVSLLIFWTGWLVLRRFLVPSAALLGLAILAVPPLFLAQWSFTTNGTHPACLALGQVCLLATHTIFVADPGRCRALLALGLLAGLGWWLDPMIIVYLAPFALLSARTGLLWQRRMWWVVLGGLIGGLPEWLYELQYFPSARFMLSQPGGIPVAPFLDRLSAVVGSFLPRLLGLSFPMERLDLLVFLVIALPLWLGAVLTAASRDRHELAWLFGRGGGIGRGHVILWITVVANLTLVLATKRPIDHYYLLPLYAVLPSWAGEFLDQLRSRRPLLTAAGLAGLLLLAGWSNWRESLGSTLPGERRWVILERRVDALIPWLRAHGFDRVYLGESTPGLISYGLTYLAGGHVIFADPWRENLVSRGQVVDGAVNPPFVATEPAAADLRASLPVIGMSVKETHVGQVYVLEPTPQFTTTFVPLHRDRWTVSASDNNERAGDLLDGDVSTVWDSRRAQEPGQWLAVDLGATELVTRIDLLAIDWQNVPGSFRVEVSEDGQRWTTVVTATQYWGPLFFSEHHPFLKVRRGRVQAIFPPVHTRHVRIVDTASVAYHSWSGRELFVYGPGGPRPSVPRPREITDALRREGIDFVYANHWLSAWVRVDSRGTIAAQESNINLSDLSRTEPDPTELVPMRLETGTGFLLGADVDPGAVKAALKGQPVSVRESMAGPYRLLAVTPTPLPRRFDKRGWQVTASENAALGRRAIDGDRRTQWTSSSPGNPALSVTVDLGQPRQLRGLEVRPGLPGRDLRVTGSLDGTTWAPLDALTWAGSLYWTGSELLRNGGPKWAVLFPRTTLRYLRLSPATPFIEPWTLAEIDAIE
jgi:hypothetical protein